MNETVSAITLPLGFKANGVYCGIKKNKKSLDLALIYSVVPATCAGVFTKNRIKAASVLVTQRHIKKGSAQAILINSGNANCLNGKKATYDTEALTDSVAKSLSLNKDNVLVASTGVIGKKLPIEKIKKAIAPLVKGLSKNGTYKAASAILTTDTFVKEEVAKFKIGSSTITIGGIAKGAGMISPNLATMLCFITTDAAVEKNALKNALKEAVNNTFNNITIDGDTSTNDTVLILANGLACAPVINTGTKNYRLFCKNLISVCKGLAKKIVSDGEGATKFIRINVKNASSFKQANIVAKKIANSPLVKTAIAGSDPNWGRIAASVGASDVKFSASRLDIWLDGISVLKNGCPTQVKYDRLKRIFNKHNIEIGVDLHNGNANATVWTCDLTEDYVKINARYLT